MQRGIFVLLLAGLALIPTHLATQAEPAAKQTGPRTDFHGDPLPEGAIARMGSTRFHHEGGIITAAFSPDGKEIIAAGYEEGGYSLRIWETDTGKEFSRFHVNSSQSSSQFYRLAYTPDGKTIIVGRDRRIELYDRQSGKLLREFADPNSSFGNFPFAVSPDGRMIATTSQTRDHNVSIHVWELATGRERVTLTGQRASPQSCEFSADGKQLKSTTSSITSLEQSGPVIRAQGTICMWDLASAEKLSEVVNEGYSLISPDGRRMVVYEQNGQKRVADTKSGETVFMLPVRQSSVVFTADSKALITVSYDQGDEPTLWDATTGKELRRFAVPKFVRQRIVGLSPDGKLLAVIIGEWNQDAQVRLWDIATGAPMHEKGGHSEKVTSIVFAPNSKLLASGSQATTVRLWDAATGEELARLNGHASAVTAVAFSSDGKLLASSSSDGSIRLWDTAKRKELAKLDGPSGGAAALTFSPDGKTLMVGGKAAGRGFGGEAGQNCEVQVWDLSSFKKISSIEIGPDGAVFAFSFDGMLALSANGEIRDDTSLEKVRLWTMPTGKTRVAVHLRPADKLGDRFYDQIVCWTAALAGDGRMFAAGHSRFSTTLRGGMYSDDVVRIWERATGQQLHAMFKIQAHSLAFSTSQRLLAIGHGSVRTFHNHEKDYRVSLWDMLTGEVVREYKGHFNDVSCVSISPDGKMLASGSADHTILVWNVPQPAPPKRHAKEPTKQQLESWWDEFKNPKSNARDAMTELVAYPAQAVKWIGERVKPAPPVDNEGIAKLIVVLDSSNYKEREKAMAALQELGELPELQLRKVLAGNPTLEARRRAEMLLEKSESAPLGPDALRIVRTIAVLEWIATDDARQLLANFAKGAPESRLTQLSQAALGRMALASAAPLAPRHQESP